MVDLPMDGPDWNMSSHPRQILEMHSQLCRQMKNLATLRYDDFADAITNFRRALSDFIGESMESCKSGNLDGVSRWAIENGRILDAIKMNIKAKGGPSRLKLHDLLEHYVSFLITNRLIVIGQFVDFDYLCLF